MPDQKSAIRNRYRSLLRASTHVIQSSDDQKKVRKALEILVDCLGDTKTITGESSVIHALTVARMIVEEMGLGLPSLIASILHDCAGKIDLADKKLVKTFGDNVLKVLKGLANIENIETTRSAYQAENFLKLIPSLAEDIRVILIKLVERLEYMRKLEGAKTDVRLRLASESYFLYAPLAHRLGLYKLKSEMEDRAMMYLDPAAYRMIEQKLKQTTSSRNRLIRDFSSPLKEALDRQNIKYEIKGRTKSIHSIWQKMKRQGIEFDEVYDVFAIRIILNSDKEQEKADCWKVYSIVTDLYQPNPSRLRDWISVPKSNGYESLHTTVIGPRNRWVEVQIRTTRMDDIAEKGLAAHYRYKSSEGDRAIDKWLVHMREILESSNGEDKEIFDQVRSDLYTDEVFVFTPRGDLKRLAAGATVLDFAFEIHTQVGENCVGAKVNGRNVGIKHVLENGDQVAVITSKNQKPKRDWLSYVVTGKAKNRIKSALNAEKVKAAAEGKEILVRRLKNWKITYDDALVKSLLDHFKLPSAGELYYQIQCEKIDLQNVKDFIKRGEQNHESEISSGGELSKTIPEDAGNGVASATMFRDYLIIENKVEGLDYKLAQCCNPVPGDKIFGFVTISEGVKIHRVNCPNAPNLMGNYPYRVLMARWTKVKDSPAFQTGIRIIGIDDHAMISKIYDVLTSYKVSLRNFKYENHDGMFEGIVYLYVPNINILNGLIKKIVSIEGVLKASRYN
ncbi:MAG TPA: bifunctional (p)ppGpp synthetase/guanosine-3',5'-bis(diphosphate) 3'-pyrophosphohydrolase [Bacteroidetes bacterium]|nr:bifunctional (p)ppGpp synthetase/guanosine-3',5'-bis(diphosphate) 3'-pyrophosphohydrolase [Bacteroidota bacterium]